MKSWMFTLVAATTLSLAFAAHAEEDADASAAAALEVAEAALAGVAEEPAAVETEVEDAGESAFETGLEAFADNAVVAEVASDQSAVDDLDAVEASIAPSVPFVESGSAAVDNSGKRGNIHIVENGDTLWDISDTYLKTPWVWPAVWQDNSDIANPHRIYPGDHIWISSTEMRKVTPEEAIEMVAAEQLAVVDRGVEEPAALADDDYLVLDEMPAAMGDVETMSIAPAMPAAVLQTMHLPGVESFSYISEDQFEGATSIVSSPSPRTWLSQGDSIVLGLGEGETAIGQQYDIFSKASRVRDVRTGRTYGYHVEVLGWAQVTEIHGDSSTAEIGMAMSEIVRGARIVEREIMPSSIAMKPAPSDLEANVIYMPANRTHVSSRDYVFIDRGAIHGVEIGSELVVYTPSSLERDEARGISVRAPSVELADLVIVSVQPTTSVAYVLSARRELIIGDFVRGMTPADVAAR